MNKMTNEHWPTVIVMNGRPYQLKKLERKGVNEVCGMCDLRWECEQPEGYYNLIKLCKSDDRDDGWYFEEDWSIFGWRISDFIDPELSDKLLDE